METYRAETVPPRLYGGRPSLAVTNPELAAEWDHDANGSLTPWHVTTGSNRKVGWRCAASGHQWAAQVCSRTKGNGCPICVGKMVLAGFNDLGSKNPALAAEWDQQANGSLTPEQLTVSSSRKIGWKCAPHGHQWSATVCDRTKGPGCPVCANQIVFVGFNDLGSKNPALAAEWDQQANGSLTPEQLTVSSGRKIGWKCAPHGHRWAATVYHRTKGRGCPVCAGRIVFAGYNDLGSKNPAIAAEWDYEANGSLIPEHVTVGSKKKVGWKCAPHGHQWVAAVSSRTKGKGCPICAGQIVFVGFNDLRSKNPALAAEWDQQANGSLTPEQLTVSSGRKIGWKCAPHGHRWAAGVSQRTAGNGCPICAGRIVFAGYNDLGSKNPAIAAEWDYEANGSLTPEQVTIGSGRRVVWKCAPHGHQWVAAVSSRTKGNGCPKCSQSQTSKIEQAFFNKLQQLLDDAQNGVDLPTAWRKNKTASADITGAHHARAIVIEYDGAYYHGSAWDKPGKTTRSASDVEKTEALLADGYLVVRIRENDLPHLPIVNDNLHQLSFNIPGNNTDERRAELVKPAVEEIMAWLDVAVARNS